MENVGDEGVQHGCSCIAVWIMCLDRELENLVEFDQVIVCQFVRTGGRVADPRFDISDDRV